MLHSFKINSIQLDVNRLITPTSTKGNFEIFYLMLAGLPVVDKVALNLTQYNKENVNYLAHGDRDQKAADVNKFQEWTNSLSKSNF